MNRSSKHRKPKPTNLKILHGEKNKDRINLNEPKPRPIAPPCPEYLQGEARAEWERRAPELEELGILTSIDGEVFEMLCKSWELYKKMLNNVDKTGLVIRDDRTEADGTQGKKGKLMINPFYRVMEEQAKRYLAICVEFGMTPSSRSRISVTKKISEDDENTARFCT